MLRIQVKCNFFCACVFFVQFFQFTFFKANLEKLLNIESEPDEDSFNVMLNDQMNEIINNEGIVTKILDLSILRGLNQIVNLKFHFNSI